MRERKSRIDESKEVVIRDEGQSYSCLLTGMSATGISVSTDHFFPTYREIDIVMEIGGEKVAMKGSTRWSIDPGAARDRQGKLGVFIISPPPAFLEYVRSREKK